MANARVRTIAGLPLAGQLDGSETLPAAQGGASVAVTADKLAGLVASRLPPGLDVANTAIAMSLDSGDLRNRLSRHKFFEAVEGYGAKNEVGRVANPRDDTPSYQSAINAARTAQESGLLAYVDIGAGSPNIGSPLTGGNNLLFTGSLHAAVNNSIPGTGDLSAMSQALSIRQAAFDKAGSSGSGSSNQWVDYVAADILPSGSISGNEKAARLTIVNHRDASVWPAFDACSIPRDGVGEQYIINCEADRTRAYGIHIIMRSAPGVKSFSQCLELEGHNQAGAAASERRQGTWATRGIIGCVAANGLTTNGVSFVSSTYSPGFAPGSFENAIFASYAAIDNWFVKCGLAASSAVATDDWFSIHKSGVITIGQSGIDPSGSALWVKRTPSRLNAAGNQNASVKLETGDLSTGQAYLCMVASGAAARSIGFSRASGLIEITAQEGVSGSRLASVSATAFGVGTAAPSSGGATNVLFISQAAAPFSSDPIVGGVAIIYDGANVILKRPDGKTAAISNWA